MKKRRILSGVLGLVLTLAMLCTGVIGVSADISVSTSTAYELGDPSKVEITSKITGITDEQITYLVYKDDGELPYANDTDGTNILFVDQDASKTDVESATGYSRTFSFVTDIANLQSSIVKFGAETSNMTGATNNGVRDVHVHGVTVNEPNGGKVELYYKEGTEWKSFGDNHPTKIIRGTVGIELVPDSGKEAKTLTVKVGGDNKSIDLVKDSIIAIEDVTGNLEITATFDDIATGGETTIRPGESWDVGTSLGGTESTAVAFSKIVTPAALETEDEYGMLLSFDMTSKEVTYADKNAFDAAVTVPDDGEDIEKGGTGIYKFQAFAKTADGDFAVKLIDNRETGNVLQSGGFYLRPYLIYNNAVILGAAAEY